MSYMVKKGLFYSRILDLIGTVKNGLKDIGV